MSEWTSEELTRMGEAEELQTASLRRDDSLRDPVTIWVVRNGGDLYVRSVNGPTSAWFRGTQQRQEGHIQAGGVVAAPKGDTSWRSSRSSHRLRPRRRHSPVTPGTTSSLGAQSPPGSAST